MQPYNWNLFIPIGQPQQATVSILLGNATVAAGVVLRLQSATINYLATVSVSAGVSLFRVYGATPRLLASWNNATVLGAVVPGVDWLTLSTFHAGSQLRVFLRAPRWPAAANGSVNIFNASDLNSPAISWGSAGMWANGAARFTNFSVVSSCQAGGSCSVSEGQQCAYVCQPG